jgi:plasmid stabilization system protein ParE
MPRLKLVWSLNSALCISRIYRFLAVDCDNREAAGAAIAAIRAQANILRQYPVAGRPSEDLEPEHRELVIPVGASGYVLIYQVWPDFVLVLSVKHQREAGYQFPPLQAKTFLRAKPF